MRDIKNLNLKYSGMMISINFVFAAFNSYGTVYLLSNNFSDGEVGIIVAFTNFLAALIQPWLGAKIDDSEKWTLREFTLILTIPAILLLLFMFFTNLTYWSVGIPYLLVYMLLFVLSPLLNAVSMYFVNRGFFVNFGVSRALGSLSYAIVSSLLTVLIAQYGIRMMPFVAMLGFLLYSGFNTLMPFRQANAEYKKRHGEDKAEEKEALPFDSPDILSGKTPFYKKYPRFMFVVLGVIMFFTFHNIANIYMYQILVNVGGGAEELGIAFALGAIVEVPMMMSYNKLSERFTNVQLMMASAVGFLVKAILTLFATSPTGIYVAMFSQMFAYGLYATVIVYYTNQVMDDQDKTKGQALVTTGQTVGGIIGSFAGGFILEGLNVDILLYFNILVSALGVIAYFVGVSKEARKGTM